MKTIHLICNAHIDPVWQWELEEGMAEALSTFRCAADFYDGADYVFNHNEALLYQWVQEYEPDLFRRIQALVKEEKWHIMGGWFLQPDCNMPCGEAFVRQALEGRLYFWEQFGKAPKTAVNFDPFGHTRGLVQILTKAGYDSYLFCRPGEASCHLPGEVFQWVGYDGSQVTGVRCSIGYNSGLGKAVEKIRSAVEACPEDGTGICLWGVGNHGGGPSKRDLKAIAELQKELEPQGVRLIHSTPEQFIQETDPAKLSKHNGGLNAWAAGCYTSQSELKGKYRALENQLFLTEKICAHAAMAKGDAYPASELKQACRDMMIVQFHDALPGSSIQDVEKSTIQTMDHGLDILSRLRAKAFFSLSAGQRKAAPDEIPVLAYNPHPYPVEGDFSCEFMLWDQNWNQEFSMPKVYCNGEAIPTQCEKERSNIPLDWRKNVTFHATLPPMSMSRFDCKIEILPQKPQPSAKEENRNLIFDNGTLHTEISLETGLLSSLVVNGTPMLASGACELRVFADYEDPWAMNQDRWVDCIGRFQLASKKEAGKLSSVKTELEPVRVVEDGPVRSVVEAVFVYANSRAYVRYILPKTGSALDVEIRLLYMEPETMVKFAVPLPAQADDLLGETAFGLEPLSSDGKEYCVQRYVLASVGNTAIALMNDRIYGFSCQNQTLLSTLVRTPAYTAHPIGDRLTLPQDRYSPHMDLGEHLYRFRLKCGEKQALAESLPQDAAVFNQAPYLLSFFPSGQGECPLSALQLDGPGMELTALKKEEHGEGYIARVYHGADCRAQGVIKDLYGHVLSLDMGPFEIRTIHITADGIQECALLEPYLSERIHF